MPPLKTPAKLKTFDSSISPSGLLERLVRQFLSPQKAPNFNETVELVLVFLFPFLFQSPMFFESLDVFWIFLLVPVNQL